MTYIIMSLIITRSKNQPTHNHAVKVEELPKPLREKSEVYNSEEQIYTAVIKKPATKVEGDGGNDA